MKRIEDIDHHFKINADIPRDYRFFDPRQEPMQLYGLAPNDQGSYPLRNIGADTTRSENTVISKLCHLHGARGPTAVCIPNITIIGRKVPISTAGAQLALTLRKSNRIAR